MNTLMFVLVLGAFNSGDLVVKPIKAFETMEQCSEAGSRVVDKFFVHCMAVEDKQTTSSPKQEMPS